MSSLNKKYKKCITYGTFDVYHFGHDRLLKRISEICDEVIIGISSDEFNRQKGKQSFDNQNKRMEKINKSGYAKEIILEENWNQKRKDIIEHNINALIMGDDWKDKFDELSDICDVIYLPRTKGISSTQIRKKINEKNNL